MAFDLILDRYEPLGTAGEGGFGTVQIAWDPRIQRKVAIKTIRLTALDAQRAALPGAQAVQEPADVAFGREEGEEAFGPEATASDGQVTALSHLPGLDEARTAAMMADPRIVTVYDFEIRDRTAYLIMEYVEGITLTDLLVDYSDYLTLDIAAAVFDAVAGALKVAHESGVLHLDIKPDNILINRQGQVKVTDFGLATLADASGFGKTGGGTIGYMPPEQIRRETLDARADEWSLASVAYEMLTGENPFRVPELAEAAAAIEGAELVLPSLCWKGLDEQIDDVLFYALDPDRSERYANVADFAEEMDKFLGNPDSGTAQLQLIVKDALDLGPGAHGEPEEDYARWDTSDGGRRSFTERFLDVVKAPEKDQDAGQIASGDDDADERDVDSAAEGRAGERKDPLAARFPKPAAFVLGHLLGAIGSGFVAALAFTNMDPLMAGLGSGAEYGVAVLVAIVAVLGAIRSHIGALVSFLVLGIALVMCGHPVAGAVLMIATVAWWYTVGHEGTASANVALLLPLSGAFGASTVVPLFSGASLKPVQAIVTTVFAIVLAVMLGGFGTGSLLGWDALHYGDFGRSQVSGLVMHMLTQPSTWATIAGWVVATLSLSLLRLRDSRALTVVGVAVALVAVLAGSLAFASPTPQLIVSSIIAAAVLIGALV